MGLDITFVKNDAVQPKYIFEGTKILCFRKRYDIVTSVIETQGYTEEETDIFSIGSGDFILNKEQIQYIVSKHEELKPLLEYEEVVYCWCG